MDILSDLLGVCFSSKNSVFPCLNRYVDVDYLHAKALTSSRNSTGAQNENCT